MRKTILVLAVCIMVVVTTSSCKDKEQKKSEDIHMHDDTSEEDALSTEYECPMDCEDGKTYEKEGKCPVCGMDLKLVEAESN